MKHPWEAEKLLEPPQALKLVQHQFPELQVKTVRLLGAGWDNSAFIFDEKFIFRFPRRVIAQSLLEIEWSLLPKLASQLPLPIPIPEWKGHSTEEFPWPFIGYVQVPGFTACYANLSEEDRAKTAEPLACFLAQLHAIPKSEIDASLTFHDNLTRVDKTKLVPALKRNLEELCFLGLIENQKELHAIIEAGNEMRNQQFSAIVHGDLYVRHLLVNEAHQIAGVIDWGDMHFGDPAIDLAIAHSFLPNTAHAAFREAYGEISEKTWALARLRALHSSCMLALFGYHGGDPQLLREALRSLHLIPQNKF